MIPWIGLLALLGLVLVVVEFLIPGFGVFGILGTIALFLSTIMIAHTYGTGAFLVTVLILILLVVALVYFVRKKKIYDKFILTEKQQVQDFDESTIKDLVGKEGITVSQLRPFGKAAFGDTQVDVFSEGEFIDRDIPVLVTHVKGKNVLVKPSKESIQ